MEYALNHACFPHDDLDRNLELAADAGYGGVELSLDPEDHLGNPDALDDLAERVARYGLDVSGVLTSGFWEAPLTSPDDETRAAGVETGEQLAAAADRLGAEVALVVPGRVDADTPYDAAYENALDGLRRVAPTAAEHGVTLAVENVWNDFLLSPLEFRDFVDAAAEAGPVAAYFDVGNVLRFGRPEQWIRILGDRIAAVHVKDYDASVDTIDGFTYPLQGDVPWAAVVEALDDVGYDGWVAPEVPPYEHRGERMPAQVLDNLHAVFEG
jgi:hexulose-6-phosphate isomerase